MSTLIQTAKACFQYSKTTVPEMWARYRYIYHEDKALQLVKEKIGSRISENSGRLNFIMAVPLVNWETTLVACARAHGECHHIEFEARGFFDSEAEWLQFRVSNAIKLKIFFEESYREDQLNILFLYLSEFYIEPKILLDFKRKNVILVHFNWDDRLHYSSRHKGQSVGVREIAKVVDLNLTMAVSPLSRYVADGAAVLYWRGSQNFPIKALDLPKIEFDRVLFFGTRYGFREEIVEYLVRRGLSIDVYGAGWDSEFMPYEVLEYKIPRYALNLGVSTIGYTQRLSCVKGRDIEVPMAGGLYLTNHNHEISNVYTVGRDILTYRNKEESYRQACEVLHDPSLFTHIRKNGSEKAQLFSWGSRFLYLTETIFNIASTSNK